MTKEMTTQLFACLLGYLYFKENYRLITTELSKQPTLDSDPNAKQVNLTGNLDQARNTTMFSLSKTFHLTFANLFWFDVV